MDSSGGNGTFIKNVLVVDDDESILALVDRTLARFHCRVHPERDPLRAFDFLKTTDLNISAVILDWNMPEISGIDLLRKIKRVERLKYIPVIMLTGRSDPEDIKAGIDAGAYYYLTKPFNGNVLSTLTRSAINHFAKIESLQSEIEQGHHTSSLLREGRFEFRTFEEADRLSRWLTQACPDPVGARLGLHELLVNSVEHGNLGISYEEKTELIAEGRLHEEITRRCQLEEYRDLAVRLEYRRTPEYVEFLITDEGTGFDYMKFLDLSPKRAFSNHGRGIAMANSLSFDSLSYFPPGNKVRAVIRLGARDDD